MTDELFAQADATPTPQTETPLPPATKRPDPPNRACLVCGAHHWQWDDQSGNYVCGSNQERHQQRLHNPYIWSGGSVPDAYV